MSAMLFGLVPITRYTSAYFTKFRERLKEKDMTFQMKLQDDSVGRCFCLKNGKISSKSGIDKNADYTLTFRDEQLAVNILFKKSLIYLLAYLGLKENTLAARILGLGNAQLEMQNALKNFQIIYSGSDLLGSWFSETLTIMLDTLFYGKYGTDMGEGVKRYTSNTNGGPCFV